MAYSPTVRTASELRVDWWKSSASGAQSDCVECGVIDGGAVAVRDSKDPHGPALVFRHDTLRVMVNAVATGTL
ncbi:DUF397 domain-containing protein [Streptomyces sp. NPDC047987]|uniref:DUF397 domain-containing protein n=1 Tax=unclassified Streptomyces TaxID=2593676 RepID=UPI0034236218